jgi:hypothetical protein
VLKHEWALLPLGVRGLDRVSLHADLTVLTKRARSVVSTPSPSLPDSLGSK